MQQQQQKSKKQLQIYQIDAFADQIFKGNPAAVIPMETYLPDDILQNIALENNLSETAYIIQNKNSQDNFDFTIRWFTPKAEVTLCGHATIAASYVIFNCLKWQKDKIIFNSLSGILTVNKSEKDNLFTMDFPKQELEDITDLKEKELVLQSLNIEDQNLNVVDIKSSLDYLIILRSQKIVEQINPNFEKLKNIPINRGVIITAEAENREKYDFVSRQFLYLDQYKNIFQLGRCFFPKFNINEDPVTGSAHCISAPYWAKQLGKYILRARQQSERGGDILCEIKENRVLLSGHAVLYMEGICFY